MHHCPTAQVLLVGTKMDMREDEDLIQTLSERGLAPLSPDQGNELALELKAISYLECSALRMVGLKEVFDTAIKAKVGNKKPLKGKKKKGDGCMLL